MYEPGPPQSLLAAQQELQERSIFPELELFVPSLIDAEPQRFQVPQIEADFLPVLTAHRLIVFGGRHLAEKPLFAKHLAWLLKNNLESDGKNCDVLQWHPQSALVRITDALDRYPVHSIFLFPGLQPHHLGGYDLRRLLEDLGSRSQYAILTTDSEPEQWSPAAGGVGQGIWHDAAKIRFPPEFLAGTLLKRLDELKGSLPGDLGARMHDLKAESPLVGTLSVRDIAQRLQTPSRIRSFAVALSFTPELSEVNVKETLQNLLDERHSVHLWFRHLGSRDQILVLGLLLLDGLLDDQVFACLELLVQNTWRDWDPTLSHFDYHELDRVSTFFQGIQEPTRAARIECLSPQCRHALFEIGWHLHRRRILATLPALAEIVRDAPGGVLLPLPGHAVTEPANATLADENDEEDSVATPESKSSALSENEVRASRWYRQGRWRDLFGSHRRTGLLQYCVAGTLSQVGRISVDAVEPILLELAQDQKLGVQAVAAAALARWRETDPGGEGDRRLFQLLSGWQSEAFQKEYAQHRRHRHAAARPYAFVRATIALTVSRAALYDPPNQLGEPLLRLLEKLVADRSRIVRSRFRNDTLPMLVASHLRQLETLLWDRVLPEGDLLFGTAFGLARAHLFRPAEAQPIFEAWHRRALAISATDPDEDQRTLRTHALAVVALAYGLVIPGSGPGSISAQEIFNHLGGLLANEDHPFVRAAVLSAMIHQARTDLARIAPLVQELVGELSLGERSVVVRLLTDLYLEQRVGLEHAAPRGAADPDTHEVIDGVQYPIWIEAERSPTAVERILHEWLQDPWRPVALQIALECLDNFAATPLEKRERQLREEAKENDVDTISIAAEVRERSKRSALRKLPIAGHLAAFVAAPLNAHLRGRLRAALPEFLQRVQALQSTRPNLLRQVWNEGKPRFELLAKPATFAAHFSEPKDQEIRLIRRLLEVPELADRELVNRLEVALGIYTWRWPLGVVAMILLALCLGVILSLAF